MSERNKTHNGRDRDGNFRVRQVDVEDTFEDPRGEDIVRDDVRLGGAIADTGPQAGASGEHIERLIDDNRAEVERLASREGKSQRTGRTRRRRR